MIYLFLFLLSLFVSLPFSSSFSSRTYQCEEGKCRLQKRGAAGVSQGHCLLVCGGSYRLWPYPQILPSIGDSVSLLNLQIDDDNLFLGEMMTSSPLFEIYRTTFLNSVMSEIPTKASKRGLVKGSKSYRLQVLFEIKNREVDLTLSTDESYSLHTSVDELSQTVSVSISASNYYGARHGLETLSQLIAWDDIVNSLIIASDFHLQDDSPFFEYRGVMLDLSRHFLPTEVIKRTIRAMSYNKMNVLHLHISDTASFPLEIVNQPNLTAYGAYSEEETFSGEVVKQLNSYAQAHGVIILPEIDTPAHVSAGWEWGPEASLGDFVLCSDPDGTGGDQFMTDALEPPSGQLNLANPNIYPILKDIYSDIVHKFAASSGIVHLGGDEVLVGSDEDWAACYNSSSLGVPILEMLTSLGLSRNDPESFYQLWQNFTKIATQLTLDSFAEVSEVVPKFHFWGGGGDSTVTYNLINRPDVTSVLPPNLFTIQVWDESTDSITKSLIGEGYDVVLSNTDYVYLDCGNAGSSNAGGYWCQPYHEWSHIYNYINDMILKWELTSEELLKVKGSETLPWGEMIDQTNIDQKLWPRSAALSEALWRGPEETKLGGGWYGADPRMQQWRHNLVKRGIAAEALQPQWCQQREAHACTVPDGIPQ